MANANWLHDASVVAAQVVKEAAGKLFNYSAYLKDAESQLFTFFYTPAQR